ncbi:MAG: GTPase Era [Gammaproteobacteria bacterium]|nr:GTPase Era [Gammaproteobacteria bacterium]
MELSSLSHCGYVAIVGRPNVGKSTLLNYILGQKISITSRKPQTTRHRILGIKTEGSRQAIYVDTPGLHKDIPRAINRYMNQAATSAVQDVDMILFMVEGLTWTDDDEWALEKIKKSRCPVYLLINKIDRIQQKDKLLPHIDTLKEKFPFTEIFPISVLQKSNLDALEQSVLASLPEGHGYFPDDQVTDKTERFMMAEIVREKIMRQLGEEIPYEIAVEIEDVKIDKDICFIDAVILVERVGQKAIVIGKKGSRLKLIGQESRKDIEKLVDQKVMLSLWVKVKGGWSDDERALKSLGYDDLGG